VGVCFRKTLEALITVDVHQRDVVEKLLEKNVHTPADFLWISQMRSNQSIFAHGQNKSDYAVANVPHIAKRQDE
jgi:hypothetical protein